MVEIDRTTYLNIKYKYMKNIFDQSGSSIDYRVASFSKGLWLQNEQSLYGWKRQF